MGFIRQIKKVVLLTGLFFCFLISNNCAQDAQLEIDAAGDVQVNSNLNVSEKVNIQKVLHLDPLDSPPANPVEGDIYFTTTKELLLYANNKWTPIVSAEASHGTKLITSGSGDWEVPAGIYSITVSLIGGGGGAIPVEIYNSCSAGGNVGGQGGVKIGVIMDVVPGQKIPYSVGQAGVSGIASCRYVMGPPYCSCGVSNNGQTGGTTTFDSISATGGSGATAASNGGNGSPSGTFPYGNYGQSSQSGAIHIQY